MASLYQNRVYRLSSQNGSVDESYVPGVDLAAFSWVSDPVVGATKRFLTTATNEWQTPNRWHACVQFRAACAVYTPNIVGMKMALGAIGRLQTAEDPHVPLLTEGQINDIAVIVDDYAGVNSAELSGMLSTFFVRLAELQTLLDGGMSMAPASEMAAWYASEGDAKLGKMLDNVAATILEYAVRRRVQGNTLSVTGIAPVVVPNSYPTTSTILNTPGVIRPKLDSLMTTNPYTGIKTIDVAGLASWMELDFATLVDPALNIPYESTFLEKASLVPQYITPTALGYTRILSGTPITGASVAAKKYEVEAAALQIDRHYATFKENNSKTLETLIGNYLDTIDLRAVMPEIIARVVDSRFYVTTWVSSWGEESAPSPVSDLVTADQNDVVLVTNISTPPAGRGIVGWRLYRTNTGTSTAEFQFVPDLASISSAAPQGDTVREQVEYVYKELNRNGETGATDAVLTKWVDAQGMEAWEPAELRSRILTSVSTGSDLPVSGAAAVATAVALLGGGTNTDGDVFSSFKTSKTSYNDAVKGSALGEVIASTTWTTPNEKLKGLTAMANGVMAGYYGNTLCFCEAYTPYAWPVEYEMPMDYPIVGMAAIGQSLFVFTRGATYLVSGADPASMSSNILAGGQACSSARSIVVLDGGVAFASPEGICVAGGDKVSVITAGLFTKNDWAELDPTSIVATQHDGVYYFKTMTKSYALDLATGKLIEVTLPGTAFFHNKFDDKLYYADGTAIKQAFGGLTNRTFVYKTGIIKLPKHQPFAWLQVDSEFESNVIVKWYGDGVLAYTATVTSITPVRLPAGRYLEHELVISASCRVTSVTLAGNTLELQNG